MVDNFTDKWSSKMVYNYIAKNIKASAQAQFQYLLFDSI